MQFFSIAFTLFQIFQFLGSLWKFICFYCIFFISVSNSYSYPPHCQFCHLSLVLYKFLTYFKMHILFLLRSCSFILLFLQLYCLALVFIVTHDLTTIVSFFAWFLPIKQINASLALLPSFILPATLLLQFLWSSSIYEELVRTIFC